MRRSIGLNLRKPAKNKKRGLSPAKACRVKGAEQADNPNHPKQLHSQWKT